MLSPSSAVASCPASSRPTWSAPTAAAMALSQCAPGNCQSGLPTNAAVGVPWVLSATKVRPGCITASVYLCAATMASQPSTRSALWPRAAGVLRDPAFAAEARRQAQQRADGDHAGAAHAADHDAPGAFGRWQHGLGQRRECRPVARAALAGLLFLLRLPELAALHRDEARAKTVDATEVFVATALVDAALAAEGRLHRLDRQAVRLLRA